MNVSDSELASVAQGVSPNPPSSTSDYLATCQNAKALGKLRVAHLTGSFADPGKQCDWGVNGNLSIQDGLVRARTEQKQDFQVSTGKATICNIQIKSNVVSRFYYDDNVIMTLNGYVLASTTDFSAYFQSRQGYYLYDWSRLVNKGAQNSGSDSTLDKQYCAGGALSSCRFPQTETTGTAQLEIGESVIQTILGLTNTTQFQLGLITTGDNDRSDCQHVAIDLNLDVEYLDE